MTEVIQVHESLRYDIIVYNYEYFNHIIKSLYNIDNESFCLTGLLKKTWFYLFLKKKIRIFEI